MAYVLRLADLGENTKIDLLTGTLKVDTSKWSTRNAATRGDYRQDRYGAQFSFDGLDLVEEVFELAGEDTAANLRTAAKGIADVLRKAREWHADPLNQNSWWLEWASEGEDVRRSLIYNGGGEYTPGVGYGPLIKYGVLARTLGITHHGLWEDYTNDTHSTTNLSCAGGKWVDATGPGSEPGRIRYASLSGRSGGGGPLNRFWCGIREAYYGTSSFNPVLEMELGSSELADTTNVADAAASGGYKKQITFATSATLQKRSQLTLLSIESTHPDHFVGRYLVLARMQLSAAATVGVQIRTGFNQTASFSPNEEIYFSDTAMRIVELGEIQIPAGRFISGFYLDTALKNFAIDVYAERLSGAGYLWIDCLYLVPSSHFAFGDGAQVQYVLTDVRPIYFITMEDDSRMAIAYSGGIPSVNIAPTMRDWYWPVGGGMMVLVGERATEHVLADSVDASLQIYPRWRDFSA